MILHHVAIWTYHLEEMKNFYMKYFEGTAGNKYINREKKFESYFLTFESGARLELMQMRGIPDELNPEQHKGLTHLAFGVNTIDEVDQKANQLKSDGFKILRGPRRTGDGYYEFESLDPDGNRFEVTVRIIKNL